MQGTLVQTKVAANAAAKSANAAKQSADAAMKANDLALDRMEKDLRPYVSLGDADGNLGTFTEGGGKGKSTLMLRFYNAGQTPAFQFAAITTEHGMNIQNRERWREPTFGTVVTKQMALPGRDLRRARRI